MVSKKNRTIRRALNLLGVFSPNPVSPDFRNRLVYGVPGTREIQDPWERRILDLCDRRSVSAVIKALYSEELSRGGWIADIGMWNNLFDQQVARTIHKLAEEGYIYLEPEETAVAKDEGG